MTSEDIDLSLAHLQAELARIDLRIQREVRRWQLVGQDPTVRGSRARRHPYSARMGRQRAGAG